LLEVLDFLHILRIQKELLLKKYVNQ
jgi:hypothetical protein